MKILKGFTLAEVLISLAVIGLVSSMTLPALNNNIQKRQIEANFQRFIGLLENANRMLISDTNTRTLKAAVHDTTSGAPTWDDTKAYVEAILPYLSITSGNNRAITYRRFNRTDAAPSGTISANSTSYYIFKDNTISFWPRQGERDANYDDGFYMLFVDLNGPDKGPSMVAKDLFWFVVDRRDGNVYGWGTSKLQIFTVGNQHNSLSSSTCASNSVPQGAISCAGSIMDNGGKITYRGF